MFNIPDKNTAQNNIQSRVFNEYMDIIIAGIDGKDCVLSGLAVTAQGSPDMTVAVAKGSVLSNGVMFAVAAANATIGTADGTNPRIDFVVISSSGSIAVRAGTADAFPKPPARTANDVVIAAIYVPASDTTISTDQITDLRVMRENGAMTIHKTTTAAVTNSNNSAIPMINLTIPNGLFLAGRVLRCRLGGNFLLNSGTATVTLIISYGGTTMFQDVTGASTNDADRLAWFLDFCVTAQENNDQALSGFLRMSPIAAKTAPTTGIGDIALTADVGTPFSGAAAQDSNAGDKALVVSWTMSVNNAACEVVLEFATVEIL